MPKRKRKPVTTWRALSNRLNRMTGKQKTKLLDELLGVLYLDYEQEHGKFMFDPDKEWDSNIFDCITTALDRYGLVPVSGRQA